jgi:hypothetical protein
MLCVCLWIPPINFWIPEPIFMKLGIHIMATELFWMAYFVNYSHQSKCLYVRIARQWLGNYVTAATNAHRNIIIVGRVIFYAARILTKEISWVSLCILLSLLGNGSINTFPRQEGIVRSVVSFAVRVISKGSRRLVLPRNVCFLYYFSLPLTIPVTCSSLRSVS